MSDENKLNKLLEPFPPHQISKLPKATKAQNEALKANRSLGINCELCHQWHHKDAIHLDYVGHAALTLRLLEVDSHWNWEPLAFEDGLPKFDKSGGLWIKLTVRGVTRLGYGHAESSNFKEIGSREKEVIGDALRNAAMRFGAALDLWHKGNLFGDDDDDAKATKKPDPKKQSYEREDNIDYTAKDLIHDAHKKAVEPPKIATYKVPFGKKFNGKTFDQIGPKELKNYRDYIQKNLNPATAQDEVMEFLKLSKEFLDGVK